MVYQLVDCGTELYLGPVSQSCDLFLGTLAPVGLCLTTEVAHVGYVLTLRSDNHQKKA